MAVCLSRLCAISVSISQSVAHHTTPHTGNYIIIASIPVTAKHWPDGVEWDGVVGRVAARIEVCSGRIDSLRTKATESEGHRWGERGGRVTTDVGCIDYRYWGGGHSMRAWAVVSLAVCNKPIIAVCFPLQSQSAKRSSLHCLPMTLHGQNPPEESRESRRGGLGCDAQ